MRKVKSKKNKSTELRLIDIFKQNGITGWKRNYPVKGHPDFVFLKEKVAVFVDGCFWHGHDCRNTRPAENKEYWQKKCERNMKHDKDVTAMFEARGWKVLRSDEINTNSPDMGIKSIIDSQKKKLLISQTYRDKDLADIIYNMLVFNNVPPEDIIYTNCDDEVSRIPEGDVGKSGIYDYLRDFFVDSYSTQKIYVIFVTSHNTKSSWGALMEVGAAWITQVEHKIFNIYEFRPEHPLDDEQQWHSSSRDDDGNLYMSKLSVDIFAQKIEYICDKLGYKKRTRQENKDHLSTLVKVTPR